MGSGVTDAEFWYATGHRPVGLKLEIEIKVYFSITLSINHFPISGLEPSVSDLFMYGSFNLQ